MYSGHSVDSVPVDTMKNHLKPMKHFSRKETKVGPAGRCMGGSAPGISRQSMLSTWQSVKMPVKTSSSIMSRYVPLCIFLWRRPRRSDHF